MTKWSPKQRMRPQPDDDKLEAFKEGERMRAVWLAEGKARENRCAHGCADPKRLCVPAQPLPKAQIVNLPRLGAFARFRRIPRTLWERFLSYVALSW